MKRFAWLFAFVVFSGLLTSTGCNKSEDAGDAAQAKEGDGKAADDKAAGDAKAGAPKESVAITPAPPLATPARAVKPKDEKASEDRDPIAGNRALAKFWNETDTGTLVKIAKDWKDADLAAVLQMMDPAKVAELLGKITAEDPARGSALSKALQRLASQKAPG
ncbi:MAG: hypothetical protein HYR64_07600 [Fimbriimonas ginsengisoli]|uniref:Magnesium transporter MgtE intracellular domain-containing protein n=1 Tax=Fimbriimonas ginsengisoli TaxID=1005039 RepID=A0A931LT31_FIMGI|nr:hypothetical protein [Fimbriimonas ginsengisoli]